MSSKGFKDLPAAIAVSRADQLANSVAERVQNDELPPGSPLGTLDDLQRASGYSRPTVSEAIRLLRDRGVVQVKPGRRGGIFVAERGPIVRLRHTLLAVADEPSAVVEAIQLRDHLESMIDIDAAKNCSESDIADLWALVERMGDASDWPDFMQANWALHERIAAICPNGTARAVYVGTLGHIRASSAEYADGHDSSVYRAKRHQVHVDLVEAIASGDPELVRRAVERHNDAT